MLKREDALELWFSEFGDKEYTYDFSGRKIKREDYLTQNQVGWVITQLKPKTLGGPDHINNTIIMHHRTLEEKGIDYPKFSANNRQFIVHFDEKGDFYYVEKVIDEDEESDGYFL